MYPATTVKRICRKFLKSYAKKQIKPMSLWKNNPKTHFLCIITNVQLILNQNCKKEDEHMQNQKSKKDIL